MSTASVTTISMEDIEEALLVVRRQSYEAGYNAGRNVLIVKDISTPLTHADKRSEHHDDEIHNNAVGNHARKLSTHARSQTGRAGFFAHRHARDASRAAAHHHKEMARYAHGVGDKDRAHRHEGAAQNHEANSEYHEKRRQDHKTERKKKGLLSRILRKGINPSSQEEIELLVKAIGAHNKRKQWIADKAEELIKEGKTPGRANRLARKMRTKLEDKKARRKFPDEFCPKCSARQERDGNKCNRCGHTYLKAIDKEIVWVHLGGIVVDPDKIQFKETDGAADGLNDERRNEEHNKEFDPLKVPPIGVWHNNENHQIYVVDGHKRVAEAKKRGIPTLRAFFIDADSFEDAKAKGEKLNVKAKDRLGHGSYKKDEQPTHKQDDLTDKLSPQEDYKQNGTKSAAFKSWFGDSKVVDSTGDPQETHKVKEVYHGTNVDFDSFKKPSFGGNAAGTGFYFSEHEDIAKQYAKTDKGRVIKAYLAIKKPFNFDDDATADAVGELIKAAKITAGHDDLVGWEEYCMTALDTLEEWHKKATDGKGDPLSNHALWDILAEGFTKDLANDILAGAGYDGLTHISRDVEGTPRYRDEKSSKNTGRIWVAFKPVQIKSVDNEGTFDPKNPVMTKAIEDAKP